MGNTGIIVPMSLKRGLFPSFSYPTETQPKDMKLNLPVCFLSWTSNLPPLLFEPLSKMTVSFLGQGPVISVLLIQSKTPCCCPTHTYTCVFDFRCTHQVMVLTRPDTRCLVLIVKGASLSHKPLIKEKTLVHWSNILPLPSPPCLGEASLGNSTHGHLFPGLLFQTWEQCHNAGNFLALR